MADKVTDALDRVKSAISNAIDRIKEWNDTHVKEKVFSIVKPLPGLLEPLPPEVEPTVTSAAPASFLVV
jgi:phage-related protein